MFPAPTGSTTSTTKPPTTPADPTGSLDTPTISPQQTSAIIAASKSYATCQGIVDSIKARSASLYNAIILGIPNLTADSAPNTTAPDGQAYFLSYSFMPVGFPTLDTPTKLQWQDIMNWIGNVDGLVDKLVQMLTGEQILANFNATGVFAQMPVPQRAPVLPPPPPPPPPAPTDPVGVQFDFTGAGRFLMVPGDTTAVGAVVSSPSHGGQAFTKVGAPGLFGMGYWYVPAKKSTATVGAAPTTTGIPPTSK